MARTKQTARRSTGGNYVSRWNNSSYVPPTFSGNKRKTPSGTTLHMKNKRYKEADNRVTKVFVLMFSHKKEKLVKDGEKEIKQVVKENSEVSGIFRTQKNANAVAKKEFLEKLKAKEVDDNVMKEYLEELKAAEEFFSFAEDENHKYEKTVGDETFALKVQEHDLK